MPGIELSGDVLSVDRPPNDLDELAIRFTGVLDEVGIDHVYVSGYVAALTGRSRATESINVLIDPVDEGTIERLVSRLEGAGLWGPSMPLDRMNEMLADTFWIARDGESTPRLEVEFVDDRFDQASLTNRITARVADTELPICPLELQIAYKLWMGSPTDFEDAVHLYTLFRENLRTAEIEEWVNELGIEAEYERLRRA